MSNTTRKSQAKKWTLIVLIVFALVAVIGGTYSRYTSTGSGTGTVDVAQWAVKINNTDITPAGTTSFNISFNEVDNDNVVDGKIAPASELYADFVINPAGSEVAIDYEFSLGAITGTTVTDIAVEKVCIVNSDSTESTLTPSAGKYTGTIALSDQDTALSTSDSVTVRVYIQWNNVEANNVAHTAAGVSAPELSMTVTGTASQHID